MEAEMVEDLSDRARSLADSMETAIDAGRLRTVHALMAELRHLAKALQAAHGVAASPLVAGVDLLACGITDAWSAHDDDESLRPSGHPTRAAFTRVRDLAIEACGLLVDAVSTTSMDAIERTAADLLHLAAVYLEASLGYYRSFGRFPDSYGCGLLDELCDTNTYEWLQGVLSGCGE